MFGIPAIRNSRYSEFPSFGIPDGNHKASRTDRAQILHRIEELETMLAEDAAVRSRVKNTYDLNPNALIVDITKGK